jgi:hypothetical protein
MRKFIKKRRVLKWINEYGSRQGWKPLKSIPKGIRRSSYDCPIARATYLLVDGTHLVDPSCSSTYNGSIVCDLPDFVRKFIDDFDEGKYPELEVK